MLDQLTGLMKVLIIDWLLGIMMITDWLWEITVL